MISMGNQHNRLGNIVLLVLCPVKKVQLLTLLLLLVVCGRLLCFLLLLSHKLLFVLTCVMSIYDFV